jgi:hypothetical protein
VCESFCRPVSQDSLILHPGAKNEETGDVLSG